MAGICNARICTDGDPFSRYDVFKASLPGRDNDGECYILHCSWEQCSSWNKGTPECKTCPKDECIKSHAIEIPNCTNCENVDIYEILYIDGVINSNVDLNTTCKHRIFAQKKTKSVIRQPSTLYCTKRQVCGFEPINIVAGNYFTTEPRIWVNIWSWSLKPFCKENKSNYKT